jgi:DNA-binding MarR family transcriptional regulator
MIDFESQSARTLLALAGGRNGIDAARCSLAFAYLGDAERLRGCLRSALARHRLSDLQFAILVLLFAAEPDSVPMAVLAHRAGVSRSAVTDAFDGLDASGLASRARDRRDRRIIHGRITAAGHEKIDKAIDDYLYITIRTGGFEEPAQPASSAALPIH